MRGTSDQIAVMSALHLDDLGSPQSRTGCRPAVRSCQPFQTTQEALSQRRAPLEAYLQRGDRHASSRVFSFRGIRLEGFCGWTPFVLGHNFREIENQ